MAGLLYLCAALLYPDSCCRACAASQTVSVYSLALHTVRCMSRLASVRAVD